MFNSVLKRNKQMTGVGVLLLLATVAYGTTTVKMNLAQLVRKSGRIIAGKCTAVEYGILDVPDVGTIPFTEYTFLIEQTIKGNVAGRLDIRVVGSAQSSGMFRITGMPTYEVGREYVLILTSESAFGFTAPVGLQQGLFKVAGKGRSNTRTVANGFGNAGLFDDMEVADMKISGLPTLLSANGSTISATEMRYEAFLSLLKKLTGQ